MCNYKYLILMLGLFMHECQMAPMHLYFKKNKIYVNYPMAKARGFRSERFGEKLLWFCVII